jgi:2'-5' RNA ligase
VTDDAAVRCFVALALDAPARAAAEAATAELRQELGAAVRWTPVDTLHLTLRFLGDVAPAAVAALGGELARRAARAAPVDLELTGAGAFPPRGRPHVLWLGITPTPALAALHAAVEDACAGVGLGRERRPYHPHLTVARPRNGAAVPVPALARALARVGFVATCRVASLHLMRSELAPSGARHTPLGVYALGAPPAAPEAG